MLITFSIVILSLLLLIPYYKTKKFFSPNGFVLVSLFVVLLFLGIFALPVEDSLFLRVDSLLTSGLLVLIPTVAFLVAAYLGVFFFLPHLLISPRRNGRHFLKLFVLYTLFAFVEQLFFQFIFLETIFYFSGDLVLSALVGTGFFVLFHLQPRPLKFRILFALGALAMEFLHATVYLSLGNIIWPTLSMGLVATAYYGLLHPEDILQFRLGKERTT
jgi:hypothetical protein